MPAIAQSALLLTLSNVFMTFAWYAHLKEMSAKPWYIAALVSWGIALFEYLLQVPANRIGFTTLTLPQLEGTSDCPIRARVASPIACCEASDRRQYREY